MVVNNLVRLFMDVGLSEYEAKAYIALLGKHPATAYETAQASGVPTSKIYEVLAKLSDKGMVHSDGLGKRSTKYIPMEPDDFLENMKERTDTTLKGLREGLSGLPIGSDVSYILNIADYAQLIQKCQKMVRSAVKSILLSFWEDEVERLIEPLMEASKRGVEIAAVYFGKGNPGFGQVFHHPIHDSIYKEKGGRGIVLVTDSSSALTGTITAEGTVEGAASTSSGFVTLAEDYIKHDIYIMKVVKRFDRQLRSRFGEKYELLRDVFTDMEHP